MPSQDVIGEPCEGKCHEECGGEHESQSGFRQRRMGSKEIVREVVGQEETQGREEEPDPWTDFSDEEEGLEEEEDVGREED